MAETLTRWLQGMRDSNNAAVLRQAMGQLYSRSSNTALTTAGLVIKGAASPLAKTGGSDCYLVANGDLVKLPPATDMAALSGTVANGKWNVFCFFVDNAGNKSSAMGTAGSSLAGVTFPPFPDGKALVGFVIINPTGAGNFVGGTTALDDAAVVPNAVYLSPINGFDPGNTIN